MKKRIIALLSAVLILTSCLAGCTSVKNDDSTESTTPVQTTKQRDDSNFKLSYTQADSLDPFKAKTQNNQVLASLVFESLFDLDEGYEPSPNLASGYEFTDSKTIKVEIKPGLKFSNGDAITSEDILYSTRAAIKSDAYGSALGCISYAEASGDDIVFHLKYANPYAVNLLTYPISSTKDDSNGFPIGNGRYKYDIQNDKTVLNANLSGDFDPYITTIHLVNIAAADSIDNAVNIGNISYAFRDMSTDTSKRLSCAKKAVAMNNLVFIGINTYSGITSNAQIRRAVSLAVDRSTLVDSAYSGYASTASSTFNPAFKGIENVKLFSNEADIATAKQAVAQSGYDSSKLKLSILVNSNENKLAAANLIKSQLELAGFSVTIDRQSHKNYTAKISRSEFDLYIGEVKLSDDMSLYPFFDSEKGGTRYGINHKKLTCDDLYKKYLEGEDELGKFIIAFNEEMPFVPLLYKKGMICYSKALQGDMQGYYGNFFSNIDSWYFSS